MAPLTQFHAEGKIRDEYQRWFRRERPGQKRISPTERELFLDYLERERADLLEFRYTASKGDKRSLILSWIRGVIPIAPAV